jgi:hypothetical protein
VDFPDAAPAWWLVEGDAARPAEKGGAAKSRKCFVLPVSDLLPEQSALAMAGGRNELAALPARV